MRAVRSVLVLALVLAASLAIAGGGAARPATVKPLPLEDGYCQTAAERKRASCGSAPATACGCSA
jgi:uncharacterized protein YdeI (BOF family)